jgi:hypothetical protein
VNYFEMVCGNVKDDEIEIVEQLKTEGIAEKIKKGVKIELSESPKLFYTPSTGIKTDFVRGAISFPVVSKKLKDIISLYEIDNTEFYPVRMLSFGKDEIELDKSNYFILNVLNRVSAFDFEKSVYTPMENFPNIPVNIKKIVIDKSKAEGRKIFRIPQSSGQIIISEDVKNSILSEGLLGVEIRDL